MKSEQELIRLIAQHLPKSTDQLNRPFESDSEIITFGGMRLLVNIDEFSEEDLFRDHHPYTLGWNLALGGVSDILATGGKPIFYGHSLVVSESWDEDFIQTFSKGVGDLLKAAGIGFIGGDFGRSKVWRYTVTVLGSLEGAPLLRSTAAVGDQIYISGKVGGGNLEAFLKLSSEKKVLRSLTNPIKTTLKLRMEEGMLIKKYATSCIDTSDGVFNSLNAIADVSKVGYVVRDLPYIKAGSLAARVSGMPKELMFLAEAGEYELLFTVKKEDEKEFLQDAAQEKLVFYHIGEVVESPTRVLQDDGKMIDLQSLNIRGRDYPDVKMYLKELINFIKGSM